MTNIIGKWALVTGASSGLGADFARILAARGCHLVLVARRTDLLEQLKKEIQGHYENQIEIVPLDLSSPGAAQGLKQHLDAKKIEIEVLINNAGFGGVGQFLENDLSKMQNMIDLNVKAPVDLAHVFGNAMVQRKSGYIMNVASVAGFQPTPNLGAYGGTKSFVLNWSESLHVELKKHNVHVTVLCPGPTLTEFFKDGVPGMMKMIMMKSEPVARAGLDALFSGRMTVVPGWLNRITVFINRLTPRTLVARIAALLMN